MRAPIIAAALLSLLAPAATAATGEIGLGAEGSKDGATVSLRGGWFAPKPTILRVEIEGMLSRTAGGGGETTRVMAGPTLMLPVACDGELEGGTWALSTMLGSADVEDRGRVLAWSAAFGVRWFAERAIVRVEAGYGGLAIRGAPEMGPFLGAGVAIRIGE